MRNSYSKYLDVKKYLKEMDFNGKDFLILSLSFLLSLLIFSGPIAILINLLIFNDTMKLVFVGIGILAGLVFILTKILFHKIVLKEHKIDGLVYYYLYDGITVILVTVLCILLFI